MLTFSRGLYVITDSTLLEGRLLTAVESALRGGAVVVQYRDKSGDSNKRRQEASALLALCHDYHVPLLINDDVALARSIHADGVHLGLQDGSLLEARQRLGKDTLIGATCHNRLENARTAKQQGASYLAFGAMFPSNTKPDVPLASPALLTEARHLELPLVAIGGIKADNAAPLIAAGAHNLAVISHLWLADDIETEARRFAQLFV